MTAAMLVQFKPSPMMVFCSAAPLADAAFHQESSPTFAKREVDAVAAFTDVQHVRQPVADADTAVAVKMANSVLVVSRPPMRPGSPILTAEVFLIPIQQLDNSLNQVSHLSTLTRTTPREVQETSCVTTHLRSDTSSLWNPYEGSESNLKSGARRPNLGDVFFYAPATYTELISIQPQPPNFFHPLQIRA